MLLRPQLAARRVDGKRADDRFRHRDVDLPIALSHLNRSICFFEDDRLQLFFPRPRTLVARPSWAGHLDCRTGLLGTVSLWAAAHGQRRKLAARSAGAPGELFAYLPSR